LRGMAACQQQQQQQQQCSTVSSQHISIRMQNSDCILSCSNKVRCTTCMPVHLHVADTHCTSNRLPQSPRMLRPASCSSCSASRSQRRACITPLAHPACCPGG
jgi:hypothetical protein